jgi:uncharacterized YigZ family protein
MTDGTTQQAYTTIEGSAQAEIVEKKSRFIGQIAHVETEEEALAHLNAIRTKHRMARHNVYAYVLRGGRVRYSDDGEPGGTSGMPTLQVLEHAGLVDVAIVTTRYFGGVLLGTGGLVRAYTQAAQAAIEAAHVCVISACVDTVVEVPYSMYEQVTRLAAAQGAHVLETDFAAGVVLTIRTLSKDAPQLEAALVELTSNTAEIMQTPPFNAAF